MSLLPQLVRSKLRVYRSVDNDFPIRLHLTTCVVRDTCPDHKSLLPVSPHLSPTQGFIFDLSAKLNALVVFIEHRYYGESLPFGNASYQDKEHLGYLTSAQALADFALLITDVKVGEGGVVSWRGERGGNDSCFFEGGGGNDNDAASLLDVGVSVQDGESCDSPGRIVWRQACVHVCPC